MSTHGPAAGKFENMTGASLPSAVSVILKWPLLLFGDVEYGIYIPAIVALGAGYYVGGVPLQGQALQTYAMAYGAAGLGYYAGLMLTGNRVTANLKM